MNKALILTGVGAGGTVISVGGAYISGAFDGSNTKGSNNIKPVNLKIPDSLSTFKKKGAGDTFVKDYFPNIDWVDGNEGDELTTATHDSFSQAATGSNQKSRLVVNWEKYGCGDRGKGDKYSGRIQWQGSIVVEHTGLIFYISAKSSATEDSKLDVEGIIYMLERDSTTRKGSIKHHKKSSVTSSISTGENNLPEVGNQVKNELKIKDYWGFTDATTKLTKLCKWAEDTNTPKSKFMGSWVWNENSEGGVKPIVNGSKGIEWMKSFYGDDVRSKFCNALTVQMIGPGREESFDENKQLGVEG